MLSKLINKKLFKSNYLAVNFQILKCNIGLTETRFKKKSKETKETDKNFQKTNLNSLENLLKERFFYDQSFSVYGSVSGLFDLGPLGCLIQNNLIEEWKKHFVLHDKMHQVDCSILTPEIVLKASGHLAKFADIMVRDVKTNESYRVDHLLKVELKRLFKKSKDQNIEDLIKKIENSQLVQTSEIDQIIKKYNIKSAKDNELSPAMPFNLMFKTEIGSKANTGYMRPETAQGIFLNFKRLYEFNQKKLPLIVAQIGKSFRNEINPKSGLIRQREFLMAEVEHFLDPKEKNDIYEKFNLVQNFTVNIFDEHSQLNSNEFTQIKLKDATKRVIKNNLTTNTVVVIDLSADVMWQIHFHQSYYIGRINEFCVKSGIDQDKIRFRQHLSNEMAHYANECWDLECLTSNGWIECAGIADRSDFDLKQHSTFSGTSFLAERLLNTENNSKESFIPHVIEPSFGIGRIMYTIFEHNFKIRPNSTKQYFSFPYLIAPYKCNILPLNESDQRLKPLVKIISDLLMENLIMHKIDDNNGGIGRRYWRSDECGIPYALTIDYDSLKDNSITIRDRDTTQQIRIKIDNVPKIIKQLGNNKTLWNEMYQNNKK